MTLERPNGTGPLEGSSEGFLTLLRRVSEAAPWEIEIPEEMTLKEFGQAMHAARTLTRKSALWWGMLYREALRRFGQDAYQLLDQWDYQESTLQNYARLSGQIHPSLWNEPIADRHFFAIGGLVDSDDVKEQRRWVEYVKKERVSGDILRKEIREDQEARGLRAPVAEPVWHVCGECHGRGGWLESEE